MARSLRQLGIDVTEVTSTTASLQHRPGIVVATDEGGEWVYIRASGNLQAGMACIMTACGSGSLDFSPLSLANRSVGPVGVAPTAISNGSYGWLCRKGYVSKLGVCNSGTLQRGNPFVVAPANCSGAVKIAAAGLAGNSAQYISGIYPAASGSIGTSASTYASASVVAAWLDYPKTLPYDTSASFDVVAG